MKFTQASIASFKIPAGKSEQIEFDETMPGFGLRVRAGGRKEHRTFIAQYKIGAKHRRMTLGNVAKVDLETARKKAKQIFGKVADGKDPASDKAVARSEASRTFQTASEDFLAAQRLRLKPRSMEDTERFLKKHWKPLHRMSLVSITQPLVAAQLRVIATDNGPIAANRARAALSKFFSWAMGEGLVTGNPVLGTNRPGKETTRDRVLTDEELAAIWKALPEGDYGRIVKLLMLTGSRRDEIASLRWSEIDMDAGLITLPGSRTKNRLVHDVPLSPAAKAVLKATALREGRDLVFGEGVGGFSGWSIAKTALDKRLSMPAWRLHDLRRTAATRMGDLGVLPHVVEAALNHISGHRKGVAGIYNRAAYAAEKRAALEALASHIAVAVAKASGGNVTRLKTKR